MLENCQGMFTPEATAQLSLALRHSRSLRELQIWSYEAANAVLDLILPALESHLTLETLTLCLLQFSAAACDALLRVIAADSTTLQALQLLYLQETEVSLSTLAGALQQNRHLQDLDLIYNGASAPIASAYEEHLLPAVQACTSLRRLALRPEGLPVAGAVAVVQLVAEREAARLAAELAKEPGRSA